MANLAAELAARQFPVTLLTARWEPHWPAEIVYRGVPVVRLPNPPQRVWGTLRYMRALRRWLRTHRGQYDLVYVSMLKHDAYAALGAVRGQCPVVLRAEGGGRSGDCAWQKTAVFGRRIKRRCTRADALVGPSQAICRELIAAGYAAAKVQVLPNGVAVPALGDEAGKTAARAALAAANPALELPEDAPLAVYTGRLHAAKGLAELVAAWEQVLRRRPDARLWLVGEGPFEWDLEARIAERNLSARVVLAGVFDSVDDFLAAADLFVLPSWEEGMSLAMLEAMAAALPVVTTDVPGNRDLVTDGQNALLVSPRDPASLAAAIGRLLDDRALARRLGAAAREAVQARYSLAAMADRHVELFERVVGLASRRDQR